jgi:hypothetical protein
VASTTFASGDRVTILKSPDPHAPNGGYPEGFVPEPMAGVVLGPATELEPVMALWAALMDEYPTQEIADIPGLEVVTHPGQAREGCHLVSMFPTDPCTITVKPGWAPEPALHLALDADPGWVEQLTARHPYFYVLVDGTEVPSHFRPDELEHASA